MRGVPLCAKFIGRHVQFVKYTLHMLLYHAALRYGKGGAKERMQINLGGAFKQF